MINPLNHHYAMENQASVYDEEALTALELAGRTTAKVNECVEHFNNLEQGTNDKLEEQDGRLTEMENTQLPQLVEKAVNTHIANGAFTEEIEKYSDQAQAQYDNLAQQMAFKMDTSGKGQVGMSHLSDEVKTAMTGGSVAVVGERSVNTAQLVPGGVTPDIMNIANTRNCLTGLAMTTGKYYSGAGVASTTTSANVYEPFPIYAGQTYYFTDCYQIFTWFVLEDGTTEQYVLTSGGTDKGDGYYVAQQNGKCYLTIANGAPNHLVTNYPTTLSRLGVASGYSAVSMDNLFPTLAEFRKQGIQLTNIDGDGITHGVVSGNTMTIPKGYTGENSYIRVAIPNSCRGKNINIAFNFTLDNPSTNFDNNYSIYFGQLSGGGTLAVNRFLYITEPDGSTTLTMNIDVPESYTLGGQVVIQNWNTAAVDADVVFTINEVYYTYDGMTHDQNQRNVNLFGVVRPSGYVVVDKNGNGDFTTLRACFNTIAPSPSNPIEVRVMPGVYEVRDEYSEAEWLNSSQRGLFVPDYTVLKGMGNTKDVIIQATYDEGHSQCSTLNLANSASLENLTVIGNKTRYAVHDDFAINAGGYSRTVKNCVFIANETTYGRPYGAGTKEGAKWTFENCQFINNHGGFAFSCHNNQGFTMPCEISFDNCRFTAPAGNACRFGSINDGANGMETYVKYTGCSFSCRDSAIALTEEGVTTFGPGILFRVSGYANKGARVTIHNTDGKDYADYVDMI